MNLTLAIYCESAYHILTKDHSLSHIPIQLAMNQHVIGVKKIARIRRFGRKVCIVYISVE